MTKTFEFDVTRVTVAVGQHSYEATDKENGYKIAMPKGGNDDGVTSLVGAYPEIETYLKS